MGGTETAKELLSGLAETAGGVKEVLEVFNEAEAAGQAALKWLPALGKVAGAMGAAGAVLGMVLAFTGEDPNAEVLKAIDGLSRQIEAFQKTVLDKIDELKPKIEHATNITIWERHTNA